MATPSIVIARPDVSANLNVVGSVPSEVAPYVTAKEYGNGPVRQTVLEVVGLPVTVANTTGASFGNVKLYDFPKGRLIVLGNTVKWSRIAFGSTIGATGSGDYSMGTTGTVDATLNSTDVNLLPSSAMADPFVSGVSTDTAGAALAAEAQFDGTTTAIDAYLNVIIDDADVSDGGSDTATFTGRITLTWLNLGDYSTLS